MEIKSQMNGGVNFTILQYLGLTLVKDDILHANIKQMTIGGKLNEDSITSPFSFIDAKVKSESLDLHIQPD